MIRRAGPDDAGAIGTLFRRSFSALTFLPTLHTPDEDRDFFGRAVKEQEVWVFEEDERVLGFAALSATTLEHFYVDPGAQSRGIGSALLARVKEQRPEGFTLWVFQRNEGARRFYERHGCRVLRLTDGAGNEEKEPDALYAWSP
jgi:putative acetyltransferase